MNIRSDSAPLTALALTVCAGASSIGALGAAIAAGVAFRSTQPLLLIGAATTALAAAMLVHAFGGLYRAKRTVHQLPDRLEKLALIGGLGAELIGAAAGCALGILALGGILPYVLLPTAAVALGSAALLVAPAQHRLSWLAKRATSRAQLAAHHTAGVSAWALAFAGMAAITLGTLALLELAAELPLCAASIATVGTGAFVSATTLLVRYQTPLDLAADDRLQVYADGMIELLKARLITSRIGVALYEAAAAKLAGKVDAELIDKIETFAAKELENVDFLEYQLHALGANLDAATSLVDVEARATRGIEDILLHSDIREPLPVLNALHAADLHDESGWKLLAQVAEEIANEELKHEIKVKYGDKAEQGRFISRVIERLTQQRFVREPLEAALHP